MCGSDQAGLGRQSARPDSSHEGGWEDNAHVRAVVLRPVVTEADGGGGVHAYG
jgi:hypothetical protein